MAPLSNLANKIKTRRAERQRRQVEAIETGGRHGGNHRVPTTPGRRGGGPGGNFGGLPGGI